MTNSTNSFPTISDSTFTGNITTGDAGGGMANVNGSNSVITNCTFDNNPDYDVETAGDWGEIGSNSLYLDPMFCDVSRNDYSLDSLSPCFGGGIGIFWIESLERHSAPPTWKPSRYFNVLEGQPLCGDPAGCSPAAICRRAHEP